MVRRANLRVVLPGAEERLRAVLLKVIHATWSLGIPTADLNELEDALAGSVYADLITIVGAVERYRNATGDGVKNHDAFVELQRVCSSIYHKPKK